MCISANRCSLTSLFQKRKSLPPSIQQRVDTTTSLVKNRFASKSMRKKLEIPEVSGIEPRGGTKFGGMYLKNGD